MIDHIDHIVLTTRDVEGCIRFYRDVLGMQLTQFHTPGGTRLAIEGPAIRTGATSKIRSVYVRDPDLNLVEISVPVS